MWLSVEWRTGHSGAHRTSPVPQPRHTIRWGWSWSTVGGFVLMWHRTVRCTPDSPVPLWSSALTSAACTVHCQSRPLARSSRCSAVTPDSPVFTGHVRWIIAEQPLRNPEAAKFQSRVVLEHRTLSGVHRTVRWILARRSWGFPEAEEFCGKSPGAPDTVRWHTGQFGAPDQGASRDAFSSLFWTQLCSFYWLAVNLWHLYNLYTRAN
jgi:hypothetical protein